jgi:hypothetical protein
MVRALLDGSKTQTRRIYKNRKHPDAGCDMTASELVREPQNVIDRICPYGQAGDRLWVKETWSEVGTMDPSLIVYRADYPACVPAEYKNLPPATEIKWKSSLFMRRTASRILLEIVGVRVQRLQDISEADSIAEGISVWSKSERHGIKWNCPLHVRRYGEGDNVEDVGFEGGAVKDPREAYRGVWSAINGPGSWEVNPWAWVIEFRSIA